MTDAPLGLLDDLGDLSDSNDNNNGNSAQNISSRSSRWAISGRQDTVVRLSAFGCAHPPFDATIWCGSGGSVSLKFNATRIRLLGAWATLLDTRIDGSFIVPSSVGSDPFGCASMATWDGLSVHDEHKFSVTVASGRGEDFVIIGAYIDNVEEPKSSGPSTSDTTAGLALQTSSSTSLAVISSSTTTPSHPQHAVSTGAIVAAVLGSLIFIVLVVLGIWLCRRRARQRALISADGLTTPFVILLDEKTRSFSSAIDTDTDSTPTAVSLSHSDDDASISISISDRTLFDGCDIQHTREKVVI